MDRRNQVTKNYPVAKGNYASGFTLVEVLATTLVIAVGMLGLSALQLKVMRSTQQSYMRTQAVSYAYDMSDRIRANPAAATSGDYDGAPATSSTNCVSGACNTAQMADYDQNAWKTVLEQLPAGAGLVTNNTGGSFTITVRWDEDRAGAVGTNCPPASSADLRCYQLDVAL
jgi:type IV pilus assembly protein PilV